MKKMNNKGFSLVELIIVIAIMAILVGVAAPQYIKYVEKSRKSTDIQTLDSVKTALETIVMDPTYASELTADITFTFSKSPVSSLSVADTTMIGGAFKEVLGDASKLIPKSKACDGIIVKYDKATDTVSYVVKGTVTRDISAIDDSGYVH